MLCKRNVTVQRISLSGGRRSLPDLLKTGSSEGASTALLFADVFGELIFTGDGEFVLESETKVLSGINQG